MISARARHLLKKYGITTEQYDGLLRKQNGCCAVCGRHYSSFKSRLAVDHDHSSNEIRGLLCYFCNRRVVGRYRKETSATLKAAYEYLNKEYTGWFAPPKRKKKHVRKRKKRPH